LICQKRMSYFQDIKEFQRLYGKHFKKIQRVLGNGFHIWFKIVGGILVKVAKKLSQPNLQRVRKCFAWCFNKMTIFDSSYVFDICLKPESFVIPLQQIDPRLSILLFQIISDVINNPHFLRFANGSKKYFKEEVKNLGSLSYHTLRLWNEFSIIAQSLPGWVTLIPVPFRIFSRKFMRSRFGRFELCVFEGLGKHLSSISLKRRAEFLCISGIFRVLFNKFLLNLPMRQMKRILKENF
jgi:hypothetical protein